ncbi:MAG: hypothetical protein HN348_05280, partial [Proteobacteria bacterium]|nr:hypothetical protein [Pseudomonadota bacterium]
ESTEVPSEDDASQAQPDPDQPDLEQPQPESPARLCADAAKGTEVEVCLRLAAQHPQEVNGIAAALRAHIDRASAPDRELLFALLTLLSEETGPEGARQLGELQDPRAAPPLVHAVETRELSTALVAVEVLANYREGFEPLCRWLLEKQTRLEVRVASARAFGLVGTTEAADFLVDTLRQPKLPAPLQSAIIETVEQTWPERVDELERHVSRDGTSWLVFGGAAGLGYSMAAAGHFGRANLAILGAGTGAVAGGTTGYVAGRAWPMEEADALFFVTSGVIGTTGGALVGGAISDDLDGSFWGGLAGEALGFGLGGGLRKLHRGSSGDSFEAILVSAGTATALGGGTAFVANNTGKGDPVLAVGAGMLAGVALGHAIAPSIKVRKADSGLILLSTTYGAVFGSLVPLELDSRRAGLPFTIGAIGALTGYGLSAPLNPGWDVIAGGYSGLLLGAGFGSGLGIVIEPEDINVVTGTALCAATVGAGLGVWATQTDPDPIDDRDVVLTSLAMAWTTWQSVGWAAYGEAKPRGWGAAILAPSTVGTALALSARELDVPVTNSAAATSIGLWGGYLSGVSAQLAGEDVLLFSLIGSDVGLVGGSFLMSPLVGTPPLVVGIADAGGVLGGSLCGLGVSFGTGDSDAILLGSLIGSGVGFTAGAILGTVLHRSGTTRNIAIHVPEPNLPGKWVVLPAAFPTSTGTAYGAQLEVHEW